jgi:hypothetical protein
MNEVQGIKKLQCLIRQKHSEIKTVNLCSVEFNIVWKRNLHNINFLRFSSVSSGKFRVGTSN